MNARWMCRLMILAGGLVVGLGLRCGTAQEPAVVNSKSLAESQRSDYVSQASFLVGSYQREPVDHSPESMAAAARKFLDSLDDAQKKRTQLKLDDQERREWTNLPAIQNAGGIRMGDLQDDQIRLACNLLANLFSDQGFEKLRNVMLADDQLLRNGVPRPGFGTENFSLVIFGDPAADRPWAFQIDGHHIGVNLAMSGPAITMSPSFIGTQPHRFAIGKVELQPFEQETRLAYQLVNSLTDDQIRSAVLGPRRGPILTGPGTDGRVPEPKGLPGDRLDATQVATLMQLVSQWVNDLPSGPARQQMDQIKGELAELRFSWNGNRTPGSDISFTIQSPSLIIEYACQDLGGNPLDHLHSMYRNPKDEYGKQLSAKQQP